MTPSGSSSSTPPQEHQEGEAGFAIMFPKMEGVQIRPFHFCKKSISPAALKEAGEWTELFTDLFFLVCVVFNPFVFFFSFLSSPGLTDNPELRVVLMFVYEAYKPGGERFLNQLLELLGKSKALIAGGIVESVFSPPKTW